MVEKLELEKKMEIGMDIHFYIFTGLIVLYYVFGTLLDIFFITDILKIGPKLLKCGKQLLINMIFNNQK